MIYVLALIVLLMLAMIAIRFGTVALMLTGLSQSLARFQARSAFFQVGFTTSEAESVVNHPVRREIILMMILAGNAGFVTVLASVVLSFTEAPEEGIWAQPWFRVSTIIVGLVLVWVVSYSKFMERRLNHVVSWALRRFTRLEAQDYMELLHLSHDYCIFEFEVHDGSWLAGQKLKELRLADEGIVVLGIERGAGGYIGAPRGSVELHRSDLLVGYGKEAAFAELEHRRAGEEGDRAHEEARKRRPRSE